MIERSEIMGSLALVGMKVVLSSAQEMDAEGQIAIEIVRSIDALDADQVA